MLALLAALGLGAFAAYEFMKPKPPAAPANTPVTPATPTGPVAPPAGTAPAVPQVQPGVPAPAPAAPAAPSVIPGLPDAVRPMQVGDLVVVQQSTGPATLVHVDDVTSDPTNTLFMGTAVAPPALAAMGSLPMLRAFARPANAADIATLSNLV